MSVRLGQHDWLNFRSTRFDRPPPFASRTLQLLAVFLTLLVLSGLFIARRMARPMADLARSRTLWPWAPSDPCLRTDRVKVRDTIRAFKPDATTTAQADHRAFTDARCRFP